MIDSIEILTDEEIESDDLLTEDQWREAGFFKKWNIRTNCRNSEGKIILSREQVEGYDDIESEREEREYDAMELNRELRHEF